MKTINAIRMAILLMSLSLLVGGCASSTEGTDFGQSELSQIVRGKTTASELMTILGTPYSKKSEPEGGEQWYYFCSHNSDQLMGVPTLLVETKTKQKTHLNISLDKNKVVVDFALSKGAMSEQSTAFISVWPVGMTVPITKPGPLTVTNSQ